MPAPPRAVFLSYASQDADVAKAIADALRAAKIVVWLDQSELRSGDMWDGQIHRQLAACTLFMPVISANTQGRREGYFRLEWRVAEERLRRMAMDTPFLVPVAVDNIVERDALVPRAFLEVHWARLTRGAAVDADLVQHVQSLLVRGTLRGETLLHVPRPAAHREPAPGDRSIVMALRPSVAREPTGATLMSAPAVTPAAAVVAVSAPTAPASVATTNSEEPRRWRLRWVLLAVVVGGLVVAIRVVIQMRSAP